MQGLSQARKPHFLVLLAHFLPKSFVWSIDILSEWERVCNIKKRKLVGCEMKSSVSGIQFEKRWCKGILEGNKSFIFPSLHCIIPHRMCSRSEQTTRVKVRRKSCYDSHLRLFLHRVIASISCVCILSSPKKMYKTIRTRAAIEKQEFSFESG